MANTTIRLKKSSVASHLPTPSQLEHGEIAINYADGKIFYKDPANSIQQISGSANTFYTVNANGTLLVSTSPTDILTINPGENIGITGDFLTDTFTITANLKSVFDVANAAFASANNVSPQIAPARDTANAAYNTANAAYTNSNNTYSILNTAFLIANAAFDKANLAASAATINIGAVPPTGINPGALWWDTISGRMFIYYTDVDSSQWVETSPAGGGSGAGVTGVANVSANPPSSPTQGSFWWNSDLGKLYIYYTDNDSAQWVEAVPTVVALPATSIDGVVFSNSTVNTAITKIVDSYSLSTYRTSKYVLQAKSNDTSNVQASEVLVTHNGSDAFVTEYAVVLSGSELYTVGANISSGNVNLLVTTTIANTRVDFNRIQLNS